MLIVHDSRLPYEYTGAVKAIFPAADMVPFDMGGIGAAYDSIINHPDIYFFRLDSRTVVYSPDVPRRYRDILRSHGLELIKGESAPGRRYPHTARYNAVRVGGLVFHDKECTDPVILSSAAEAGLEVVDVAQGYSRCSVVVLSEGALITQDRTIAAAASRHGVEVLAVPSGGVALPGERYGFIGGASGNTPSGEVLLLGDADLHMASAPIRDFFGRHKVPLKELKGLGLYDSGSLMIF